MAKGPRFGAKERSEMADRIFDAAFHLRKTVASEKSDDADMLLNRILDDLDLLDTKRVQQEARRNSLAHNIRRLKETGLW